ncbi:peroxiredoxin family protein [Paludisphaera borealis]|uniref:Thiol-disulfide oxidoreductase ResA n=1 Tax=Paludisphaera borealis TaxID=1387353 RepID=A0A1U7CQF0_9BACT|nr:TlpA disulfide reductase family protein [Paludisphaera borealis]APW61103.1 Thiol-disulfide oxidoreductase ResA [Paludisphaera borealis]
MRILITSAVYLFLATTGAAQTTEPQSVGESYKALRNEWDSREKARQNAFEKAATEKEREAAAKLNPASELEAYIDRFLAVAERDPKDAGARDALFWILETGRWADHNAPKRRRQVDRAMDLVLEHHRNDDGLGSILPNLVNYPTAKRDGFLRAVYETTTARAVKGPACWGLAEYLRIQAGLAEDLKRPKPDETDMRLLERRYGSYLDHLRSCDPGAMLKESEALCERALDEYGDLPYRRGSIDKASKKTLADVAERTLNEIRHLAVGNEAPEIVGQDADGTTFKLSDYRGKVVVLTFSGNWCAPCRGMYPQERELVERLKDKPFALLSVNTDESKDTLRKSIQDREVTWRCWWDGRTDGPICAKWSIYSFPTLYLLDAQGVIRSKGLGGKALDEAVDALLTEIKDLSKP